jgi:hypothetical protein
MLKAAINTVTLTYIGMEGSYDDLVQTGWFFLQSSQRKNGFEKQSYSHTQIKKNR